MSQLMQKGRFYNWASLSCGVILALLSLEIFFRQLPVNTGLVMIPVDTNNPIQRSRPHQPYVSSRGWLLSNVRMGRTNNYGFVNADDYYQKTHPVVVMGDSYIESLMNDYHETLHGRLAQHFSGREKVYSISTSGASLSDYLVMAKYANVEFSPKALVILITSGDVEDSFGMSIRQGNSYFRRNSNGTLSLYRTEYQPSKLKEVVKQSALFRYVYLNLKVDVFVKTFLADTGKMLIKQENIPDTKKLNDDDAYVIINNFLDELPSAAGLAVGSIVLVMDDERDRASLYAGEKRLAKDAGSNNVYFMKRARALGYEVVDMGAIFAQDFRNNGMAFDYSPLDSHWNPLAHGFAEQVIYPKLMRILSSSQVHSGEMVHSKK